MGCARCDQLEKDIRDLLSEMNFAARLRHVTNIKEIALQTFRLVDSGNK